MFWHRHRYHSRGQRKRPVSFLTSPNALEKYKRNQLGRTAKFPDSYSVNWACSEEMGPLASKTAFGSKTPILHLISAPQRCTHRGGPCIHKVIYVCMYMCICVYVYTCICVYVYMCVCAYVYVCAYICVYIYIYIYIYTHQHITSIALCAFKPFRTRSWPESGPSHDGPYCTANLRTNSMDFRGFDSSIILILRGGIPMSMGDFP